MNDILRKYIDHVEKLGYYLEEKHGCYPISHDDAVDQAIQLLETLGDYEISTLEDDDEKKNSDEWFEIQTVDPDRNVLGSVRHYIRKRK